ncbi:SGNH/GDSL hydrolase family protein [Methylobacterium flocculans]|uniref:hypothetical protein n=1 Tax=Methylobacterium flocculans TaxID=2984843 RepID=UPI0021F26C58|nr:hypothetical protein [Methylobacterium sp. FF17]
MSRTIEFGTALAALGLASQAALADEVMRRGLGDAGEAQARQTAVADLLQRIRRINAGLYPALRPGDNPSAFSGSFDKGNPDDLAPLSDADYPLQVVDDGLGRDLFATRDIWERALHPVGGGELWRARWSYQRRANSSDPSNDSVQRFVFWYGPDRSPLSATEVGSEAPVIASGSRAFSQIIGSNLAIEGALEPPPGAAYFRIGIRAYGLEQRTTVTDLGAVEITDALQVLLDLIPPDSAPALAAALAEEERRATAAEASLGRYADTIDAKADALRTEVTEATDAVGFANLAERFGFLTAAATALDDRADHLEGIPALGVGAVTLGAPPVEAAYLTDANVVGGVRAGGVRYGRQPDGRYLAGLSHRPALGVGALVLGAPAADEIRLDGRSIVMSGRAGGRAQVRTAAGRYDGEASRRPALGIGALGGDLVTAARLDAGGRPVAYATAGRGAIAVTYVATPAGLIRQEVGAGGAITGLSGGNTIQSGSTLLIPAVTLALPFRSFTTRGGSVTRSVPAAVAVADELVQCRDGETEFLAYQFLGAAPVTGVRQDNGQAVTEGTHFTVNRQMGYVVFAAGFSSSYVPVKFAYQGYPQRAGFVSCGYNGVPVLTEGQAVGRTCSMYEPTLPAGHTGIARTFQYVDASGAAQTEMSWIYLYDGLVKRDEAAVTRATILRNRGLLSRARRKAMIDPARFRLVGTGDSRTQVGGAQTVHPTNTADPTNQNFYANVNRDTIGFFETYSADAKSKIPRYTFNNGANANDNVKVGWNWVLLDYLARVYGVTNAYASQGDLATGGYLNFGINGTTFAADAFADGRLNGTNPARLSAQTASRPHLAVIAYGANQSDFAQAPGQIETLVNAFEGVGCDCLFLLTGRPNSLWKSDGVTLFRDTCDAVRRTVNRYGHEVAYADTQRVFDPETMSAAGLSEFEIGEASTRNHDGVKEFRLFGGLLIEALAP